MKKLGKILFICMALTAALAMGVCCAQAASLSSPTLQSAENQAKSVQLTWSSVSGAKGYYVYRKETGGKKTKIAKVKETTYTDTAVSSGTKYTYSVKAYKGSTSSSAGNSLKITYLSKPTISSATVSGSTVTLKWKQSAGATGYKLYRKASGGSYTLIKTIKDAAETTYTDSSAEAGTSYTYKIIAYKGSYKSVKSTKSCTTEQAAEPTGTATIENTSGYYAVEADVKLSGSGTGYHAKMVITSGTSAVSFGLQYDSAAASPYTGQTAFLVENIASNSSGGQEYTHLDYAGSKYASSDTTYHLMMTVKKSSGRVDFYVNGVNVGYVKNSNLANTTLYIQLEGSARKNGDQVNAVFSNVKVKADSKVLTTPAISAVYLTGKGLNCSAAVNDVNPSKITISGTLKGLTSDQDWDNAYDIVSGVVQYYNENH